MNHTWSNILDRRPILFREFNIFCGSIFPNSSFMLLTLSNFLRVWVRFVHSIKICFTVYWFPQEHLGGSSFRMKEWVSLVWPMHSWARAVSSILVFRSSFLSFRMGCILSSLLWVFWSHSCYHFFVNICLILCFKSVCCIFEFLSGTMLSVVLASESALGSSRILHFCSGLWSWVCSGVWQLEGYLVFYF